MRTAPELADDKVKHIHKEELQGLLEATAVQQAQSLAD